MKNNLLLVVLCLQAFLVEAQFSTTKVFSFLKLPSGSNSHALGSIQISTQNGDVSNAFQNPAVLNPLTDQGISINYNQLYASTKAGYVAYADYWKKYGLRWHTAVKFLDYGKFKGADTWGNKTRSFKAAEYAFVVGVSKALNERFHLGINSKFIYSRFENYHATGIAFDVGAFYHLKNKAAIGLVANNMGFLTKDYANKGGLLPFDIQLAYSKRLKHLPFQFSITGHHLYVWNLRKHTDPYKTVDPNEKDNFNSKFARFSDNLFRHIIFGGELLLGKQKNFKVRIGYNHLQRQEMRVNDLRSMSGFSYGVEFKIKQFFVAYSAGIQHLHGSTRMFSLHTNLNYFSPKEKKEM